MNKPIARGVSYRIEQHILVRVGVTVQKNSHVKPPERPIKTAQSFGTFRDRHRSERLLFLWASSTSQRRQGVGTMSNGGYDHGIGVSHIGQRVERVERSTWSRRDSGSPRVRDGGQRDRSTKWIWGFVIPWNILTFLRHR
jgi:hypothetical protein